MLRLKYLGIALILALSSGCSDKNKQQAAYQHRNLETTIHQLQHEMEWVERKQKDAMSDEETISLTTLGKSPGSSFELRCDRLGETVFFDSSSFLNSGAFGTIQTRFDNDEPKTDMAFVSKSGALIRYPFKPNFDKGFDKDAMMMIESSRAFFPDLKDRVHTRLRVRLTSFDNNVSDVEFNISGLKPRIAGFEKDCSKIR